MMMGLLEIFRRRWGGDLRDQGGEGQQKETPGSGEP